MTPERRESLTARRYRAYRRRRGYGLIELAMAVFLLAASLGVMVKALNWVGIERRAADRRVWAVLEVSNLMERLTAEPFDSIAPAKGTALAEASAAAGVLPGAAWEFDVKREADGPVPSKRVTVRLRWKDRSAGWDGPVSLTSWVHRRRSP